MQSQLPRTFLYSEAYLRSFCLPGRQLTTDSLFYQSTENNSLFCPNSHKLFFWRMQCIPREASDSGGEGGRERSRRRTILIGDSKEIVLRLPESWIRSACHLSTEPSDCPSQEFCVKWWRSQDSSVAETGEWHFKEARWPSSIWNHFACS